MQFFARFFENLQQDLKAFVYWCLLFTIFRIGFIAVYATQLSGDLSDIPMALLLGLRLSLKTAGYICLFGFVFSTLPKTFCKKWAAVRIRTVWHFLAILFFTICFMARIPYYKVFNAAFNMMLINGAHDDIYAIVMTAIQEYQLLWRLPLAILLGVLICYTFSLWMRLLPIKEFADVHYKKFCMALTFVFLPVLVIFTRYGGAFNYANSINWESAARLKSNLLNEAVLDDGQALYRVYASKKMLDKVNNINITKEQLLEKIVAGGGNTAADNISEAFLHRVQQPKLSHQPSNVVVLLGESFGAWQMLPKYADLGLSDKTLALQNSTQGTHIASMLAHGSGTISAVNGLVAGLPDTGLYENYQPNSMKAPYETGIGYIMKKLGYKTVFWYGGFGGWQNLKNFVLAQSFDEFHCADEFVYEGGTAWGCADEVLLQEVNQYIANEAAGEKVFHVVLTTSNHPPYEIKVDKLGFPRQTVKEKLTDDISKDDKTLTELGHIWYADKTMSDFVAAAQKEKPDSLFVITGDHSERFSFAKEQDIRTLSAIPCVFYGAGVRQDFFTAHSTGTTMQLAGTLAEMIAPAGFTYSAMLPSMFTEQDVFNHRLYVHKESIDELKNAPEAEHKRAEALRGIAAWRVLKGNRIE